MLAQKIGALRLGQRSLSVCGFIRQGLFGHPEPASDASRVEGSRAVFRASNRGN
jgi:hypothetical protein